MPYFIIKPSQMNDHVPFAGGDKGAMDHYGEPVRFRMMDDDGIVYFTGYFYGDHASEDGFIPLDSYGEAFGCTSIEYMEGGVWTIL